MAQALLIYFDQASDLEDDTRQIIFEHIRLASVPSMEQTLSEATHICIDKESVNLHNSSMEAPAATSFVNFANETFGFGCFIASCTQGEILQVR